MSTQSVGSVRVNLDKYLLGRPFGRTSLEDPINLTIKLREVSRDIEELKYKCNKINIAHILQEHDSNYGLSIICLSLSIISIGFALFSIILQYYFDSFDCI